MNNEWVTNQQLETIVYGAPRYVLMLILGVLLVYQIFLDSPDLGDSGSSQSFLNKSVGRIINLDGIKSNKNVVITVGGDLRYGPKLSKKLKGDYSKPLANLTKVFHESDINYITLEGPVTDRTTKRECTNFEKDSRRCCDSSCFYKNSPEVLEALNEAGINVMGIENDHMLDYGKQGLQDTIDLLEENNIIVSGVGYKPTFQVKGCSVEMLSYNWAYQNDEFFENVLKKMDKDLQESSADIKVVMMHGGNQNSKVPSELQKTFAKKAVKNGASVVVGTHSKLKMSSEFIDDTLVVYGLGSVLNEGLKGNSFRAFNLLQLEIKNCEEVAAIRILPGERLSDGSKIKLESPILKQINKQIDESDDLNDDDDDTDFDDEKTIADTSDDDDDDSDGADNA